MSDSAQTRFALEAALMRKAVRPRAFLLIRSSSDGALIRRLALHHGVLAAGGEV